MPSVLANNRPQAAGRTRSAVQRIARTLAIGVSDRMKRRQVHNVEAQVAKLGQPALGVPEGAGLSWLSALRSHEHLVPRPKASLLAIDDQLEQRFESRQAGSLTDALCRYRNVGLADDRERRRAIVGFPQSRKCTLEQFAVSSTPANFFFPDECNPLENTGRSRPRSLIFLGKAREPRRKQISPC